MAVLSSRLWEMPRESCKCIIMFGAILMTDFKGPRDGSLTAMVY
jgi:hypothetical protein